jgi:hypothetical protein
MNHIRNLNKNGLVDSKDCLYANGRIYAPTPNAFDSPRAIRTCLDKPPQVSGINSQNIYTEPSLQNYNAGGWGGNVNNAQITYYIDESIKAPYYPPNFDSNCKIYFEGYVDPMSSVKPHYRVECPLIVSDYSFINDTNFYRQDLMSKQMALINQSRIEPFL